MRDAGDGPTEDDLALAQYGAALADGIEAALPAWVERSVERLIVAWTGVADPAAMSRAAAAGRAARDDVGPRVRSLLAREGELFVHGHPRDDAPRLGVDLEDSIEEESPRAVGTVGDEFRIERHAGSLACRRSLGQR